MTIRPCYQTPSRSQVARQAQSGAQGGGQAGREEVGPCAGEARRGEVTGAGPAPAPAPKAASPAKPPKIKAKLVRDSFTMPASDFALIAALKERALGFKRPTKRKAELCAPGCRRWPG